MEVLRITVLLHKDFNGLGRDGAVVPHRPKTMSAQPSPVALVVVVDDLLVRLSLALALTLLSRDLDQ